MKTISPFAFQLLHQTRKLSLGLFLIFLGLSLSAQESLWDKAFFVSPAKDLVAAAQKLKPVDAEHVSILFQEGIANFGDDGSQELKSRLVYQILDDQGVRTWSDIQVSYSPWHQEKPVVKVRVSNPDGGQYDLRPEDLIESSESPDSDVYSDGRKLSAPYPRVTVGSVVEEEITTVSHPLLSGAGILDSWSFGRSDPIVLNRLTVSFPNATPLRYQSFGFDLKPTETKNGNRSTLVWQIRGQQKYDFSEVGTPPGYYAAPRVMYTNAPDWKVLAQKYAATVDPIIAKTMIQVPKELNLSPANPKAAALALMHWINSKIRYTGMELGINSIVPVSPETVFERGYGDCKDKAIVLVSLLKKLGVDASVALLWSGSGRDVEPIVSGLDFFDHAIVWVNPGTDPFFVDPTLDYSFDAGLPYSDQYRYALVARNDSPGLIRTPQTAVDKSRYLEIREAGFSDLGQGDVRETTIYEGTDDAYYRNYYANRKISTTESEFADYSRNNYGSEMQQFNYQKPDDYTHSYSLSFFAKGSSLVWTGDERAEYNFPLSAIWDFVPDSLLDDKAKPRKSPYRFNIPLNLETRSLIRLPDGFSYRGKETPVTRTAGVFTFTRTFEHDNEGRLVVIAKLQTNTAELTPQQFDQSRKALIALKKDFTQIDLDFELTSKALLEQGKYKEAFDVYKNIIAIKPNNYIHYKRLSSALLDAGLGDQALAMAKKATELAPKESDAWNGLAWVQQFDSFGTRFGFGYDRAGAIASYKKALSLNPKAWWEAADLAILYEHDMGGFRYSPAANLEDAIATYKGIDDLAAHGYDQNLWYAYFYAGKLKEAEAMADTISDEATRNTAMLLHAILEKGVDAAMDEIGAGISAKALSDASESAVEVLLATNRYSLCAELLRASARGNKDSLAMENRADAVERIKTFSRAAPPFASAADTVKAYYRAMEKFDGKDFTSFSPIFDDRALEYAKTKSNTDSIISAWASFTGAAQKENVTMTNFMDVIESNSNYTVKGDANDGWTVLVNDADETRNTLFFLLPRADKQYRISATATQYNLIGAGIRDGIAKGNYARALKWLQALNLGTLEEVLKKADKTDGSAFLPPSATFMWAGAKQDQRYASLVASMMQAHEPKDPKELKELDGFVRSYWGSDYKKAASEWGTSQEIFERAVVSGTRLLFQAYQLLKMPVQSLEIAKLYADKDSATATTWLKFPTKEDRTEDYASILSSNGKFDDARVILNQLYAKNTGDRSVQVEILRTYMREGNLSGLETFIDSSKFTMDAVWYNNLAWMDMFGTGLPAAKYIEYAKKSVTMTSSAQDYNLHTLATLYARTGRLEDARRFLNAAIGKSEFSMADADDYVVLGLIAQGYGFNEAAASAYRRVLSESTRSDDSASSTEALARKLLKELDS